MEFSNTGILVPGPYSLTVVSAQVGQADTDFDGFAVNININDTILEGRRLLRGYSGYNFSGTDTFDFDLESGVAGNYLISFDWTNPAEDASKGTKRQLFLKAYTLRHITTELFKVEVNPWPSTAIKISPLASVYSGVGTQTPGGWFAAINSYGTTVSWEHESTVYTGNDTVTSIYPVGDTLSPLTNERRNDVIYTGTDVVISDEGSYTFPSFGSVAVVPVYNPPVWFWAGAMTTNPSATITARMTYETPAVRVAVSESLDFGTRIYSDYVEASTATAQRAKMVVDGLKPWTTYFYAVENAGSLYTDYVGTLATFGTGPRSFSFGLGCCENNTLGVPFASNALWPVLNDLGVLFMFQTGDWHYYDIATDDINQFRVAYDEVLSEAYHNLFYRQHPVMYVYDDHDFGPNDSDTTSLSKPAARRAYRETVPHYPLSAGNADEGNQPIYQSFTVGRCRFIVTDCASERSPYAGADGNNKIVLGEDQLAWFKAQLLAASNDPDVAATFWVSSFAWTGTGSPGVAPAATNWAAYTTQRSEIAEFIRDNGVAKLFILSGDMHAAAFDDGRTYDFATDGTNPFPGGQFASGLPVFQAGPLGQTYSQKGMPYMIGPMLTGAAPVQQTGVVTVYDYGTNLLINFCAYDETGAIVSSAGTQMNYTLNGTASPRPFE
jgi:alkaline phosphatase D